MTSCRHVPVFYHRRQDLFVLSTAVLLSALLLRGRVHTHPWVLPLFLPPIAFVLLRLVVPHPNGVVQAVDRVLVVASFVLLPFVTAIVVRLLAPRYFTLPAYLPVRRWSASCRTASVRSRQVPAEVFIRSTIDRAAGSIQGGPLHGCGPGWVLTEAVGGSSWPGVLLT